MAKYVCKTPRIGPYSADHMLARLDGRTREAALLRTVRAALTKHVGGSPNEIQSMLIQRACILSLRLAQIDRKIFADRELTLHDNQWCIAWQNALTRTLVALGADPKIATALAMTRQQQPQLAEYLDREHAA